MPGRAIHNAFLDKVNAGERFMRGCRQCIKTCDVLTAPYCITEALINAVEGRLDEGLIFCGSNACRAEKIETVKDIMELGSVGRNKANTIRSKIATSIYGNDSKIRNRGLVPMAEVLKYFSIDINYLKEVSTYGNIQ